MSTHCFSLTKKCATSSPFIQPASFFILTPYQDSTKDFRSSFFLKKKNSVTPRKTNFWNRPTKQKVTCSTNCDFYCFRTKIQKNIHTWIIPMFSLGRQCETFTWFITSYRASFHLTSVFAPAVAGKMGQQVVTQHLLGPLLIKEERVALLLQQSCSLHSS